MSRVTTELHPKLQTKLKQLQTACTKQGLKIGISECVRTVAEQNALYAKGRTVAGSIVTNAKGSDYKSMHQWGVAFDFYRNDGKGAYYDKDGFFTKVGKIGQSIGLEWGGSWSSIKDLPHFQLPDWGSTPSKLISTYGKPEVFMKKWSSSTTTTTTTTTNPYKNYTKAVFIKDLQKIFGMTQTGKASVALLNKTVTLSSSKNSNHAAVLPVQKYLRKLGYTSVGTPDCNAGGKFNTAVTNYQKKHKLEADGEITAKKNTWRSLLGMAIK